MAFQPKFHLRLQTDRLLFLDHEARFSLVVFLTLSGGQPITLIRNDSKDLLGLKELLVSQCIECTDVKTGQPVPVFGSEQVSQSPRPLEQCPASMTLEPKRANYMTFTTDSGPRDYEFKFDPRMLKSDRTYKIQCKPAALQWWSHDSQEKVREYYEAHGKLPPPEAPPLECEPVENGNIVTFDTRTGLPPAPKLSVSISAPSTMSLSSNPKFTFTLSFTSHAQKPITILAERAKTQAGNTDIEIIDAATRKRLAPDLIDDGNADGPWLREDFLGLEPGVPYIEHRTFDPAYKFSGLDDLQVDGEYLLRMLDNEWGWWSFDDVDTVLGYAGERGAGRLGPARPIPLVLEEEIKFRAVA